MLQNIVSHINKHRNASPSYKTRNEVKPEVVIPKQEKPKRTNKKKVVENITLKL